MTLEKLISNFELLGDWEERYGYLIDLGKKLPGLPDAEKSEDNRVHGCQAMVWMIMEPDQERSGALRIRADSDAFIVRGLIAVLQLIFNGRTCVICEEQLVKQKYPQYLEYAKVTKRMVPYLF